MGQEKGSGLNGTNLRATLLASKALTNSDLGVCVLVWELNRLFITPKQ